MNKWNNLKKCTFIDEIYIDDENGKPIVIVDTKERNVTYKDEEAKTDDNIQKMITDIFNNLRVYQVENRCMNKEQYKGREQCNQCYFDLQQDYINAESEEEAIRLGMEWLVEDIREIEDDEIIITNDEDEIVEVYYDFTVRDMTDYL